MRISIGEASSRLTDLVRRAEAGDEIVLTRHGRAAVRLVPIRPVRDRLSRRPLLEAARTAGAAKAKAGPGAARARIFSTATTDSPSDCRLRPRVMGILLDDGVTG